VQPDKPVSASADKNKIKTLDFMDKIRALIIKTVRLVFNISINAARRAFIGSNALKQFAHCNSRYQLSRWRGS
jgi:hypothetical protein